MTLSVPDDTRHREHLKALAREHWHRWITCPTCGERLKGKSLVRHFDRLHAFARSAAAFGCVEGYDAAAAGKWFLVMWLCIAAMVAGLFLEWRSLAIAGSCIAGVAIVLFLAAYGYKTVSQARLVNRGGSLTLRRRLWFPTTFCLPVRSVEIGPMKDSGGGSDGDGRAEFTDGTREWSSGSYLNIEFASGRLLLHLPWVGESRQRARWSPSSYRAGKQRHCNKSQLSLSREDTDIVQRWLLEQGALVPQGGEAPAR